ncbi:nuclear transport factor 2 family protein [Flavobacterium paronense]|uniref:Nuclear transport factor 2 family protein n=1 Tax=Flavobacterium paronense TaxID=1392775 RepID=A0ABV5GAA9_9FLAO|nr:nuclear transport factor 2 family protein [Flavobacterium paronense]MDN3677378.1 nuclear transport factor 2 family protein [Flavobacterium paronense]
MKNKILKGIALGLITALFIACQPKKEEEATAPVADKEAIKAELQTMESAFADAMNAGKPESIVYYSDDVISYDQNAAPLNGKKAVDAKLAEQVKNTAKGNKISYTANEVFPSSDGNQVVEIGSYKVVDSTGAAKASGNYMALFEKRDGKYVCIRDMGSSDMPKEEKK